MFKPTAVKRVPVAKRYSRFVKTVRPTHAEGEIAKALTPKQFYRKLHEIADKATPEVRKDLVDAFARMSAGVSLQDLQKAVEGQGSAAEIMDFLDLEGMGKELNPVMVKLQQVFIDAGLVSEAVIPKAIALSGGFNVTNPYAVDFLQQYRFSLIKGINDGTREGIRQVITDAFEKGGHPYTQAQTIKSMIGLTQRQVIAADNYANTLALQKLPKTKVNALVKEYKDKQLKYRADNIARTETIRASNAGQNALWHQMEQEGVLDTGGMRRIWIITPDDRLCETCASVADANPEGVKLGQPFQSDSGDVMFPPLHPQCRCAVGLVDAADAAAETKVEANRGQAALKKPTPVSVGLKPKPKAAPKKKTPKIVAPKTSKIPHAMEFAKPAEFNAWVKSNNGDWADRLTEEQHWAIVDYQQDSYRINSSLRAAAGKAPRSTRTAVEVMTDAFQKAKLDRTLAVYRGADSTALGFGSKTAPSLEDVKKLLGKTFTDKAFVSTSWSKRVADSFVTHSSAVVYNRAAPIRLKLILPKGTPAAPVNIVALRRQTNRSLRKEGEILVQRGSKFMINKIEKVRMGDSSGFEITATYIESVIKANVEKVQKAAQAKKETRAEHFTYTSPDQIQWDN